MSSDDHRAFGITEVSRRALPSAVPEGGAVASAVGRPPAGVRRVARVEENTATDGIVLTTDQLQRLNTLTPATGARHDETNTASIDR